MNSQTIIRKIAFGAVLASISIILKLFVTYENNYIQVSIFEFPILLSGIILGPLYGALVGITEDIVYFMINIRGLTVGFNLFTAAAMLFGLIPGFFFYIYRYNKKRLFMVIAFTLILSFVLSTIQTYLYQGSSILAVLPYRIIILVIKIPVIYYLLNLFLTDLRLAYLPFFKEFHQKNK